MHSTLLDVQMHLSVMQEVEALIQCVEEDYKMGLGDVYGLGNTMGLGYKARGKLKDSKGTRGNLRRLG